MFRKINLKNAGIILSAVILLASVQLSYADGASFTVNIPNAQGGYTAVVIQQSGTGYVGPQGEYYPQFPSVAQLQAMYGANDSNPTVTDEDSSPTDETVDIPPPELPVYVQPDPPGPNYIWTPGYWAYDSFFEDYYWVPGTWVRAPEFGLVWTPGYWHWRHGRFFFSEGYWGHHIGFYGGVNYGHGYRGQGTCSFNGGPDGIKDQPTREEQVAMKEKHIHVTDEQRMHLQEARKNPGLRASANHGKPAIAATAMPGVFKGKGVMAAKQAGAFYNKTKPVKPEAVRGNRPSEASPKMPMVVGQHANILPQVPPKPAVKKPTPQTPPTNVSNPPTNVGNPQNKNTQNSS